MIKKILGSTSKSYWLNDKCTAGISSAEYGFQVLHTNGILGMQQILKSFDRENVREHGVRAIIYVKDLSKIEILN